MKPPDESAQASRGSAERAKRCDESAPETGVQLGCEPACLTPIQRRFFEVQTCDPQHFNQALLLGLEGPLDLERLGRAVQGLFEHHDALRLRFRRQAGEWTQWVSAAPADAVIASIDLREEPEPVRAMELRCEELQRGFDLECGPLFRVVHYELGPPHGQRLLLLAHHLIVDGVSWRVLLADLAELYSAAMRGASARLTDKPTPAHVWANHLQQLLCRGYFDGEIPYWRGVVAPVEHAPGHELEPAPKSGAPAASDAKVRCQTQRAFTQADTTNTLAAAAVVSASLDERDTRWLLREAAKRYDTEINDLLLSALVQSCYRTWGRQSLLVELEGHGREELGAEFDLTRTVLPPALSDGTASRLFDGHRTDGFAV